MGKHNGKRPEEGQYVNMPYAMLKSPAWRSLSGSAIKVWFELSTRFNGGNNGKLYLSFNEAATALGIGKATAQRAYKELQDKGFLELTGEGSWYGGKAHEWRLTTKAMQGAIGKTPPTHDWRSWQPKTKRGSKSDPSPSTVVPFENPKQNLRSTSAPVRTRNGTSLGSDAER